MYQSKYILENIKQHYIIISWGWIFDNIIKKKLSLKAVKKKMLLFGATNVDYVEIYDINKVTKPYKIRFNFKIFIAYYLRSTRMIDNI